MLDPPLHVLDGQSGVTLIPAAVEILGDGAELDNEVSREILRLGFARFSRQSLSRLASSSPMMIRASEPPIKERRSDCAIRNLHFGELLPRVSSSLAISLSRP
jgi:hypothetical protein